MQHRDFFERRKRFCQTIGKGSIAILKSAKEAVMSSDSTYPYRQNSDFYYLTGFTEFDAVAVFIPGRKEGEYILFSQVSDPEKTVWTGEVVGQKRACTEYGADQAFPIEKAAEMIPGLILNKKHLYFDIGYHEEFDWQVIEWLKQARRKIRLGQNAPDDFSYTGKILHEMRMRSSAYEIDLLKKSAKIAVDAHIRAMLACKPGVREYEIEAELCYEYFRQGGKLMAFEPVVAAGKNSCVLHYTKKDELLKDGDLVLIDSGVDYQYYTSDITRTLPVSKKFTLAQKAIYQAVLDAQLAVIRKVRPGVRWHELQETSEKVITEKLLALGILSGKVEKLYKEQAFKPFYMHRIGHWLGIDNHDVGKYALDDDWRILEPGMSFTVEPGIYISPNTKGIDKKWLGIGVRIEDDILVTKGGCEVLTDAVPKTIEEIEKIK